MHVEMDISGSKLSYVAGDHVAIFPINNPQMVERIGKLLQTDLDTIITLTNLDGEPVSVKLLTIKWDLYSWELKEMS